MIKGKRTYIFTYEYFMIRLQTSNDDSYRNERRTDHQINNQLWAYIASLTSRGMISHKGLGMRNWPLPGSVEVQHTRRCGATAEPCTFLSTSSKGLLGFRGCVKNYGGKP